MDYRSKLSVQSNRKKLKIRREARGWVASLGRAAAGFPDIAIGAQNVHHEESGAFTGEISAPMLADAGARCCVLGHSERRKYCGEAGEPVNRKVRTLLGNDVSPSSASARAGRTDAGGSR